MNLEDQIYTLLSSNSAITALVVNRISPEVTSPDSLKPFIVYSREETEFTKNLLGEVLNESGKFSIQCCSNDKKQADDVGKAVVNCFSSAHYEVLDKKSSYDDSTDLYFLTVVVLFD